MSSKTEIPDVDTQLKILYGVALWEHRKLPFYLQTQCPVEELQNAGYFGLVEARSKYDPMNEKGLSFYDFATWKIKFAIWAFLHSTGMIRLPNHIRAEIKRINKAVERLSIKLERHPTLEEISQEMAISPQRIKEVLLWHFNIESITDISEGGSEPTDSESWLIDEEIIFAVFGKDLEDCLNTVLTQKEIIILLLKEVFGLTLEQVSKLLGDEANITKVWRLNRDALKSLNNCLEKKGWPKLVE